MELRQREARLELLQPGAWDPESFSPAAFERVSTARSEPAEAPVGRPDGDGAVECAVLRLPTRQGDESGAWSDAPPWRRGPQRGRRGGWTR